MKHLIIIAVILAAVALTACSGTAHIVRADAHGGIVKLGGPYMDSVAAARLLMAEHCDGRFVVWGSRGERVDAPSPDQDAVRFDCEGHGPGQVASSR